MTLNLTVGMRTEHKGDSEAGWDRSLASVSFSCMKTRNVDFKTICEDLIIYIKILALFLAYTVYLIHFTPFCNFLSQHSTLFANSCSLILFQFFKKRII